MTGYFSPDLSIEDPKDAKTINLRVVTNNKYVHDWASIDKCERWEDYHTYRLFPNIKKFISTLPFKSVGRVFISFTENKTKYFFGDVQYARVTIKNNSLEYFKFLTDLKISLN